MLIIYYLRRVLFTGYEIIKFIKFLKGSIAPRARISNINSRNEIIEPRSCKIEKRRSNEERLYFPKPKIYRVSNKILREIYSRTAFPPQICQI